MKGRMTRPRMSSRRTEVIFALSLTPNSQLHQFPIQRARGRTAEGDSVRERKEGEGEGGRFGAVRRIYQTSWISFAANRRCAASATDARSRSRAPCPGRVPLSPVREAAKRGGRVGLKIAQQRAWRMAMILIHGTSAACASEFRTEDK